MVCFMDGEENEINGLSVHGYPSLFLYFQTKKEPVEHFGPWSHKEIQLFLAKYSATFGRELEKLVTKATEIRKEL